MATATTFTPSRWLAALWIACGLTVLALMAKPAHSAEPATGDATASEQAAPDFTKEVQPILAKRCYACHGPDLAESGLSFVDRESATAETDSGEFAIVPGDVDASLMLARITSEDEWERMPPEGDALTAAEIDVLSRWIAGGASWTEHWAWEPLPDTPPAVPQVAGENVHPIDAFVQAGLDRVGLEPNPPADRRALIRRAYYDLIGLPPTAEQVQQFVDDPDPKAFERLIDELLAMPQYGERWGRHWLDLVRYAETNSFERDGAKPNAWKYRDYVIRSFNEDKPYDQFVREQLAGDELDEVTVESLTATGYYRLGIWDDEPADPIQARYDELDDLVATTGQVFLGLTINCARCHDHKIDPIPQTDYFSMLAFMADVSPYGHRGDQSGYNQIDVSSEELANQYAELERQQRELEQEAHAIEQAGIVKMSAEDQRATEGPRDQREAVLKEKLRQHLDEAQTQRYEELRAELRRVRRAHRELPPREVVLGLARYEPLQPTRVHFRGNPHSPTDEVQPAFPALFELDPPEIDPEPTPRGSAGRRRVLADWIVEPQNRLTSRVMVNRVWQYHFGRGIVRTSNNFGQLGTPPTHPDLLDWLAMHFVEGGWKLKDLHRLMMTSQTYQRSSTNTEQGLAIDPGNDFFWRFDPRRLSAEEVRDSVLAVNGSLNDDVYGPSFYAELSAEVLAGQSQPGAGWGDSSDEQQNRRSIYIHVKRSLLTPLLTAFDYPEPDRTCEARFMTLQPGQALSLLNSEFIHKQAKRLADSIDAMQISDAEIARRGIVAVLAREATQQEIEDAEQLIEELQNQYGVSRERAVQLYCLTLLNWNAFLFLD